MDAIIVMWFFWWFLIAGAIGHAIGKRRRRGTFASIMLGVLLGPVGWVALALGPDYRPRCPECKGVIDIDAKRCRHCGVVFATPSRAQQLRAAM